MWDIIEPENTQAYQDTLKVAPLIAAFFAYLNLTEIEARRRLEQVPMFHAPQLYHDLVDAKKRILKAIETNEKMMIYGDYDCDGMLATTILRLGIESVGGKPDFYIPNRFIDGYGMTKKRVQQCFDEGYSLMITVDNGIVAHEAIDHAIMLGMDVIVTDHHQHNGHPVQATFVVHPLLSDGLPFKTVSGGVVAYKLACSLMGKHHPYLWTLAMITTISDMMPFVDENHSIVKQGLHLLNKYQFETLSPFFRTFPVSCKDISFQLVPVINTVGRMPDQLDPCLLVEYLSQKMDHSKQTAFQQSLKSLNQTRKNMVEKEIGRFSEACQNDIICIFDDALHEGLTGLLASRFVNQYQKPTFVFALDHSKTIYKGSARSIEGFLLPDVFEALEDLLLTSGGHHLAGGLSCLKEDAKAVQEALGELTELIEPVTIKPKGIHINGPILIEDVLAFESLAPFGYQFEKPKWILTNVTILSITPLKEGKHLKLWIDHMGQQFDAMVFNFNKQVVFEPNMQIDLLGELTINTYRNQSNITFIVDDTKQSTI